MSCNTAIKPQIQKLSAFLQAQLIERETPAKLALLATLGGEHLLLFGPPGTAKSALARKLRHIFTEGQYFERLLTRFSVPEELFGPLSIKALEADRYERLIEGYLPCASIAFIDEIFKANSAILNTLLTLLNEREFDNSNQRIKTPLACVIAASNELPAEAELQALYDRFLFRYQLEPISQENFSQLFDLQEHTLPAEDLPRLNLHTLRDWQQQARQLPLHEDVIFLLQELRQYLQTQQIYVSDRRWHKTVQLLKMAAFSNEQQEVSIWDCWLLQFCLWQEPTQQQQLYNWYQTRLGSHQQLNPERINKLLTTWQKTLQQEQQATEQRKNAQGEPLYNDPQTGLETSVKSKTRWAEQNGEHLYLAPPDQSDRKNKGKGYLQEALAEHFFDDYYQQCHIEGKWVALDSYIHDRNNHFLIEENHPPCLIPANWSGQHIQQRLAACEELRAQVHTWHQQISRQLDSLDQTLQGHLWIPDDFIQTARSTLQQTLHNSQHLTEQIDALYQGFKALPCNDKHS